MAAISVTPSTCIVDRIVSASTSISRASFHAGSDARRLRDLGIEGREEERAVPRHDDDRGEERDDADREDVGRADAEDAPEERGVEAPACVTEDGEEREPERERRRRDHPDRRVGADHALPGDAR